LENLITFFLTGFFRLLYNEFAWTYNLVANIVSLGLWYQWVDTALPFLDSGPVLELGFGTGRLLEKLKNGGVKVIGIDKSKQMVKLAKKRGHKQDDMPPLVNGDALHLPFSSHSINNVASTFPSEYILNHNTMSEVLRVLSPGGRLVIIPTAWITGKSVPFKLAARLFQITHQSPAGSAEIQDAVSHFTSLLQAEGFSATVRIIDLPNSKVLCILAEKPLAN
jgi:ubiquinone/menaquinone biosynthesis C-methylase UbiE